MSEFDTRKAMEAYPEGIEHGFWTLARNRIIDAALRQAVRDGLRSEGGAILEVGCGPGIVVAALRQMGHFAWGVELGSPPIRAAAAPFVTAGAYAQDLHISFRSSVETIMLLDVIEHIEDDVSFLQTLIPAFPNCRCIIITVPARPEVWSNYDDHFGHFRRYTVDSLNMTITRAGIRSRSTRYFFTSLYIAARLINAVKRPRAVTLRPPALLPLHRIVAWGLGIENRLLAGVPVPGLSLLTIAEVQPAQRRQQWPEEENPVGEPRGTTIQ
jgi:hypothetical protein